MRRDVFGQEGDFITSPEVSQLFGEVPNVSLLRYQPTRGHTGDRPNASFQFGGWLQAVGVWCALQWQQLGCPSKLKLVELGPGRGTLMADLLRGTSPISQFANAVEVHLVEVSTSFMKLGK